MITKFDPAACRQLREQIGQALGKICADNGLGSLSASGGSYDDGKFILKVTAIVKPDLAAPSVHEKYIRNSQLLGYSDNIIGKEFMARGAKFVITDILLNRPAWPILGTEVGGSRRLKIKPGHKIDGVTYDREKDNTRFR